MGFLGFLMGEGYEAWNETLKPLILDITINSHESPEVKRIKLFFQVVITSI